MPKTVFVNSKDEYLILRLRVLCVREGLSLCENEDAPDLVLTVYDADEPLRPLVVREGVRTLTVSRSPQSTADLHLPIANSELARHLSGRRRGARLALEEDNKYALIDGESVRLTEIEAALLRLLIEAQGECVSHEDAVKQIWSGEASAGAVNVYIHYLREKLERGGERVILAKRGRGYAIDKRFLGGADEC